MALIKIDNTSNFYIAVTGRNSIEALERELRKSYPELTWRGRGDESFLKILHEVERVTESKILSGEKIWYIHINPSYRLSYTTEEYTAEGNGLKIIDFNEIYNKVTKNSLLNWINV